MEKGIRKTLQEEIASRGGVIKKSLFTAACGLATGGALLAVALLTQTFHPLLLAGASVGLIALVGGIGRAAEASIVKDGLIDLQSKEENKEKVKE